MPSLLRLPPRKSSAIVPIASPQSHAPHICREADWNTRGLQSEAKRASPLKTVPVSLSVFYLKTPTVIPLTAA